MAVATGCKIHEIRVPPLGEPRTQGKYLGEWLCNPVAKSPQTHGDQPVKSIRFCNPAATLSEFVQ